MASQMGVTTLPVTIASGQSLSGQVDIGPNTLVGIVIPASWTAAGLTFQASPDGGTTWAELTTSAGAAVSFTVAGSQFIAVDPTTLRGVLSLKIRSGTPGAPVVQTPAAVLTLVLKAL
jgi:hypothetical protein